jgi:VanZ family protein
LSTGRSPRSSEAESAANPAWFDALTRWLPVVVWAAFISWFSTDAFSARSTNSYIDPVLRFFFGELTPAGFRFAHTVVRKSAHTIEYAILAVLTCRALATNPTERLPRATLVRALLYCAMYALIDEAHQTFVPSRTGSGIDVGVDVMGATLGALLLMWRRAVRARTLSGPFRATS